MNDDEPMYVEGERAPRFGVYEANSDLKLVRLVGQYESVAEVLAATKRLDKVYRIKVGREYPSVASFRARFT